jgi:hypothetical protein
VFSKEERFGAAGEHLFSDLNGNVPEDGDDWLDFAWSARDARRFSESPKVWKDLVAKAVADTAALSGEAAPASAQAAPPS